VGSIPPEYVSFNLEFPGIDGPVPHGSGGLSKVTFLASQIAPTFFRLGGNSADVAVYAVGREAGCKPHNNSGPLRAPGVGQAETCFSLAQMERTSDFARNAGARLVFDLNEYYSYGSPGEDLGGGPRPNRIGPINLTNAEDLLRHLADYRPDLVPPFLTLGNELPNNLSPSITASDFQQLETIIKRIFPSGGHTRRPYLLGTDSWWENATWIENFFNAGPPNLTAYQSVIARSPQKGLRLWMTETGAAWGGGIDTVGPSFADGFWFLDQLGSLAVHSLIAQHRHALVGSWGPCFIGPAPEYNPRPDFFTAVLWKRLIGEGVLRATKLQTQAKNENLRVYAHCHKSRGVVLVVVNLGDELYTLGLKFDHGGALPLQAEQYWLSAPGNNISSTTAMLNGHELKISTNTSGGWQMPDLHPLMVDVNNHSLSVPPLGYGFFVVDVDTVRACDLQSEAHLFVVEPALDHDVSV